MSIPFVLAEQQQRCLVTVQRWWSLLWWHRIGFILTASTSSALAAYFWDVNSWKFAYVGDEWVFYTMARTIAAKHLWVNPFDMHGVYGFTAVLGSTYQAVFLCLFGETNSAWRFSNIILIVPISIFFFRWMRDLLDKDTAMLATILLQGSFYIANYLKIGYVNAQAFALFVVALALASQFTRRPTWGNAAWLGGILGIAFYVYIGPLFPLFVVPTLLPLLALRGQRLRTLVKAAAVAMGVYVLLVIPGLLSIGNLASVTQKTSLHREYTDNAQLLINIQQVFLSFYHNYDYYFNHFITGPYLDLGTRILATIGMLLALVHIRNFGFRTILVTYVVVAVVIGITSPYAYAAATRGIFFIPFGAAFAGMALAMGTRLIQRIPVSRLQATPLVAVLLASVLVMFIWKANVYQSQVGVFNDAGYGATNLIVRTLQTAHAQQQHDMIVVVAKQHPYRKIYASDKQWPLLQQAYGLQDVHLTLLDPTQVQCAIVQQHWVVYFADDVPTSKALLGLHCSVTMDYHLIVLNPTYPL